MVLTAVIMKLSDLWNVTGCSLNNISNESAATIFRLVCRTTGLQIVENGTLVSAFVSAVLITDEAGFSRDRVMKVMK
jgi:hypothetical protein